MERIGRDQDTSEKDRVRDRTKPRKKRRFDSGPDPEKVKETLTTKEVREEFDREKEEEAAANILNKKPIVYSNSDVHAKRAYIGNIPIDTDPVDLQCFLNISMSEAGGCLDEGNPVLNSRFVNLDKRFMFVELRSVEETTCLMQLDGIKYRNHFLKIRRPVDYEKNAKAQPERPIPKLNLARLGIVSSQVEDSDLKLYVGGLSLNMNEEQIKKVLMRYGMLKSFRLVKEKDEIISKGYAF